ncbi:MAG: helicase-related protein, partial [Pirellula sp.]
WVSGSQTGTAATVRYRSTRQLIGKMTVMPSGKLSISYDILDGKSLRFSQDSDATPYVPDALPRAPRPPDGWTGPEKLLRPAILWAALHFAAPDDQGRRHTVLISVTQRVSGYAKDFLELLERHWMDVPFPSAIGTISESQQSALEEALIVCRDYFGETSYEYRLLSRGIAIHHSSMPKSLSRRIIELIGAQTVSIVLATSTLSEGINIPVETILVPSLYRGQSRFIASEFRNLAGRAGRPGVATEGRTLVVLPPPAPKRYQDRANRGYSELLNEVLRIRSEEPQSPLGNALDDIWQEWRRFAGKNDYTQFLSWLERANIQQLPESSVSNFSSLDSIDSVLLAGIVENEEFPFGTDWEIRLQSLWNASFASRLASEQQRLAFIHRGTAIPALYPNRSSRRRLYRTGLPPSTAFELFREFAGIELVLAEGREYSAWTTDRRFQYVVDVVKAIGAITRFRMKGEEADWIKILKWWMWRASGPFPAANKIADWHREIGTSFTYRCCWALGSIIGFAFEQVSDGEMQASSLDDWEDCVLAEGNVVLGHP